jgi:hypothetical protein
MAAPLILYIDTTRKVLVANFTATVSPGSFALEQGDNVPVQLHFLQANTASQQPNALPYSYIDPATVTPVTMAIGQVGLVPTSGTFTVTFGANTTAAQPFNVSAATLQTALNALASIISAGGVTVQGNNGGPWTVIFNNTGAQSNLLAIGAGELVPPSLGLTQRAVIGATGVQEQQVMTLVQIPAAVQNTWTPTYPMIGVSRLQAGGAGLNEIQRVTIPTGTYSGTFSLAFGGKSTASLAYNISASALQTALAALSTIGANNVNVVQSGVWTYDITFVGALAGLSQSLIVASGAGLSSPMYLSAQVNLNTQGIFNLLTGLTSILTTLQVQQGSSGNINTVLQMPITLNAALILGTPSVPNPSDPWQTLSQVNALIAAAAYVLPAATTSALGGVKVPGAGNLLVDGSGNISVPTGTNTTFGVFKVDNATITAPGGVLTVVSSYSLPPATTTTLGGVKVPAAGNLSVDGAGNISVAVATAGAVGVVSVPTANGLSVNGSGVLSMAQATAGSLGTVQPDGTVITVAAGVITVPQATNAAFGVVKVDGTSIVSVAGVISAANGSSPASPTAKVGLSVVNGSSSSFMRADAAPPLDLTIVPTWTGSHSFTAVTNSFGGGGTGAVNAIVVINSGSGSGASPTLQFNSNSTQRAQLLLGTATGVSGPAANDFCVMGIGTSLVWFISNSVAAVSVSSTVMAIKPTTAATSAGGGALTNAGGMATAGSTRCQVGTSAVYAAAGGTVFEHFTGVSNGTNVETTLFSDTLAANSLVTNGDMLRISYGLTTLAHASATREIRFYFGATVLFDSTAQTTVSAGTAILEILLIRQSSTVLVYQIQFNCPQMPTPVILNVGTLTAQSFTVTNLLKLTGQSSNTTGDITALTGRITYHPAV